MLTLLALNLMPRVGAREIVEHPHRSVIRGIVADDQFKIGEVLRQD